MFKFELGLKVKDIITGFSGVITGRCEYLTGCRQYSISSNKLHSGDIKQVWFDEDRLNPVKGKSMKIKKNNFGGPQLHPSKG
jgi:hypothetical protein